MLNGCPKAIIVDLTIPKAEIFMWDRLIFFQQRIEIHYSGNEVSPIRKDEI